MIGVDVGFENPLFAALEVDYGESDQDPTGEAFDAAQKVSRVCAREAEGEGADVSFVLDAHVLRTRSGSQSRRQEVE